MNITEEILADYLQNDLAIDVNDIDTETLLFSTGVIDSFALISLMTFIETEGGIRILPADVNLTNFDSISRILAYVNRAKVH